MRRQRADAPPNPGARAQKTRRLAQARTALLSAAKGGVEPVIFFADRETRGDLTRILQARPDETIDALIVRLIHAEAARIAAEQTGEPS